MTSSVRPSKPSSPRKTSRDKPEHRVTQYAHDVVEGRIVAGRLVRLACDRHLRDLKSGHLRGLYFDEAAADHAIEFFECHLRLWEGSRFVGQPFLLESCQAFIVGSLFGWKRADGFRRFRKAYIETARKQGKSPLAAGIGAYLLAADGEAGAQIYSAATKEEQAKIIFKHAKMMIRMSPTLRDYVEVLSDNLHVPATESKFEPLAADADTMDGLNVHGALIDEYHKHKTREVYDALDTATGTRDQPILLVVTTAGSEKISPCRDEHDLGVRVLEGQEDADERFFYIAALDEDDDWTDEACWVKANPLLGVTTRLSDLREEFHDALRLPAQQNAFKRNRLNMWTGSETAWISSEVWREGSGLLVPEHLEGRDCFGGLDLSSSIDLTALILWFPPVEEGEKHKVLAYFWLPSANLAERCRRDKVPYDQWAEKGYISLIDDRTMDFRFVQRDIVELGRKYHISRLTHDPWRANDLMKALGDEGFEIAEMPQGRMTYFAVPTAEFEKLAVAGRIEHGGNPVLAWMVGCAQVKSDPTGSIRPVKPDRKKSSARIDGVVAAIMALDGYLRLGSTRAYYEDHEILVG